MPDRSTRSADHPEISERRRHARQRVDGLCAVTLGQDNGGIVLNISEDGLQVQAVAPVGPADTVLEMRFWMPRCNEQFRANGRVVWVSASRKEAGVSLIDLSDEASDKVRTWIAQHAPVDVPETIPEQASEKGTQIIAMPPVTGYRSRAKDAPTPNRMSREELDSLFPSEKIFLPGREAKPMPVSEAGSRPPLDAEISMKDWVSGIEERAKAARDKFTGLAEAGGAAAGTAQHTKQDTPNDLKTQWIASTPAVIEAPLMAPRARANEIATEGSEFNVAQASWDSSDEGAERASLEIPLEMWSLTNELTSEQVSPGFPAPEPRRNTFEPAISHETVAEIRAATAPRKAGFEILRVHGAETLPAATPAEPPQTTPEQLAAGQISAPESKALGAISTGEAQGASGEIIADLRASLTKTSKPPRREFAQQRWEAIKQSERTPIDKPGVKPETLPALASPPPARNETIPAPGNALETKNATPGLSVDPRKFEVFSKTDAPPAASMLPAKANVPRSPLSEIFEQRLGVSLGQAGMLALAAAIVLTTGLSLERKDSYGRNPNTVQTTSVPGAQTQNSVPYESPQLIGGERLQGRSAQPRRSQAASSNRTNYSARAIEKSAVTTVQDAAKSQVSNAESNASRTLAAEATTQSAGAGPSHTPEATAVEPPATISESAPATTPPASLPTSAASSPTPITGAGDRVVPASLLYRVEPVYPPDAKRNHVEGAVKLNAVIGRDGRVIGLGVLSGPTQLLQAALSAAREWRYLPALLNGAPVETQAEITVEFKLPSDADR